MDFYTTKFHIVCEHCGDYDMPSNNTANSILWVLDGSYYSCGSCGKEWSIIDVPFRPLVKKIATTLKLYEGKISERVNLFKYKGKVPMAVGK